MPYKAQIRTLNETLNQLDNQISKMETNPYPEEATLVTLKNKRMTVFNELRRLNKLQWDEDHERVNLDDDR